MANQKELDDLLARAQEALDQEKRKETLPTPDEVKRSKDEWEKKYGDYEQKEPLAPKDDEETQKGVEPTNSAKVAEEDLRLQLSKVSQAVKLLESVAEFFNTELTKTLDVFTPSKKESDKQEVVLKKYLSGFPVKHIMDSYDISSGQLYSILRQNGVNPHRNHVTLGEELGDKHFVNKVVKDYVNGEANTTIYERYNINKNTLYTILDMNNVERRRRFTPVKGNF